MNKLYFFLSVIAVSFFIGNAKLHSVEDLSSYMDDLYIGFAFGSNTSQSLQSKVGFGFQSFILPQRTLEGGIFSATMGMRPFIKSNFWQNMRIEAETQYVYQRYSVLNRADLRAGEIEANAIPKKGKEALKGNFAFNTLYDIKYFSPVVYPYIGAGAGYGKFVYSNVDIELQPNGLGEWYNITKNAPFGQFILGVQYDTKVVKASMFVQYKYITSFSAFNLNPANDGIQDIKEPEPGAPENPTEPTTSPRSATYSNHSLMFGFKYYLY